MNFSTNVFRLLTFALLLLAGQLSKAAEGGGRTINGRIVDAKSGEALIGVNVTVEGSTEGTASDVDGSFRLTVKPGATIVFSYVGYVPLTMKAADAASRTLFQLEEEANALDEVVIVGYGQMQRRHILRLRNSRQVHHLVALEKHLRKTLQSGDRGGVQSKGREALLQNKSHFFSFRRSRISVSSCSSLDGAGGGGGGSGAL